MSGILHSALLVTYGNVPKVLSFQGFNATTTASSNTYTNAPIGTASSDRYVIVGVIGEDSTTATISGVTCAGNAMTNIAGTTLTNSNSVTAFYILNVTSGTTATIVATFTGNKNATWIGVWTATGLTSTTPIGTATQTTDNTSTALTTTSGGFAIGIAGSYGGAATYTWTNLTERFDNTSNTTRNGSGADATTSGSSLNITSDATSGSTFGMSLVSF